MKRQNVLSAFGESTLCEAVTCLDTARLLCEQAAGAPALLIDALEQIGLAQQKVRNVLALIEDERRTVATLEKRDLDKAGMP